MADGADDPASRRILAIGEAKAGETITDRHLSKLEAILASYGTRAARARLLLIGSHFSLDASGRSDVEVVDLERLNEGD